MYLFARCLMMDDDEKMKKDVVVEKEMEIVLGNDDDEDVKGTVRQAREMKRVRKRKGNKKKYMALPWLGGALHYNPPSDNVDSTLLTFATIARWRVLGHYARGDGDVRSESTPRSGMGSFFSFHV